MKYLILFAALLFPICVVAQVTRVSTPQHIAIDSKDNLFVGLKYGIIRITPDGSVTNLTKEASTIGDLDRKWNNLIIDSRDNLYANDGKLIYKFTFDSTGKFVGSIWAGQKWSYELKDGPLATAGFNIIGLMTIDTNDNIYLTDSADKIKDTIGTNFVTDNFNLSDLARKTRRVIGRVLASFARSARTAWSQRSKHPTGNSYLRIRSGVWRSTCKGTLFSALTASGVSLERLTSPPARSRWSRGSLINANGVRCTRRAPSPRRSSSNPRQLS
jgi:hypothetical protein